MVEQRQDDQLESIYKQHCDDTGCNLEDLPGVMDNREEWRAREREREREREGQGDPCWRRDMKMMIYKKRM